MMAQFLIELTMKAYTKQPSLHAFNEYTDTMTTCQDMCSCHS